MVVTAMEATNVNCPGHNGLTALFTAARDGHLHIVNLLLHMGADVNLKNVSGSTPLLEAVSKGHVEIVSLLLEAGADPNIKNNAGETGLHIAAIVGNVEIVKLFVDTGVDINLARVSPGSQLWEKALKWPCGSRPKMPNLVYGHTPLHLTVLGGQQSHYKAAKLLIEHGALVNAHLPLGRTALHFAAYYNAVKTAELLLHHGCDVNPVSKSDEHKTPLMIAAEKGHLIMVKLLIAKGAHKNLRDHIGRTSILSAIFNGKTDVALHLMRAGCDVNRASKGGLTPFQASLRHPPPLTQMLILSGCRLTHKTKLLLDDPIENLLFDTYPDVRSWILSVISNPKPLQQLCRETFRNHFAKSSKPLLFDSLPVPPCITKYLNLKDVEELLEDSRNIECLV